MNLLKTSLAAAIALLSLASCGKKQKTAKISPESTTISGDLSPYLQIVDNQYSVDGDIIGHLAIKVKALKPFPATLLDTKDLTLTASLLDENGAPLSKSGTFSVSSNRWGFPDEANGLIALLKRGSGEEVIVMQSDGGFSKESLGEASKFSTSSMLQNKPEKASTTNTEPNTDVSSSVEGMSETSRSGDSKADFDRFLDDYEKSANAYIKMIKGMDANDPTAMMGSYADAMQATLDMESNLKSSEAEMTAAQISRMLKIQAKMSAAMLKSKVPSFNSGN